MCVCFYLFLKSVCFVFHCFCLVNDLKTKKARNKRMIFFFMHQQDQFQQHISKWSIYNTLEHKTRVSHDKPTCVCLWASREYVCTVNWSIAEKLVWCSLCSLFNTHVFLEVSEAELLLVSLACPGLHDCNKVAINYSDC